MIKKCIIAIAMTLATLNAVCMADSAERLREQADILREQGERVILEGVQQIQAHQDKEDAFKINVWISGAYLRLAKILISDQKSEQAKTYLSKGEQTVLKDPRLVIRKQQLEILKKKIDQ